MSLKSRTKVTSVVCMHFCCVLYVLLCVATSVVCMHTVIAMQDH